MIVPITYCIDGDLEFYGNVVEELHESDDPQRDPFHGGLVSPTCGRRCTLEGCEHLRRVDAARNLALYFDEDGGWYLEVDPWCSEETRWLLLEWLPYSSEVAPHDEDMKECQNCDREAANARISHALTDPITMLANLDLLSDVDSETRFSLEGRS
jgi:hypothetical protein